jgi:heme-degrading monooxygenase HmoA
MVYEHARITVKPGNGPKFEEAFRLTGRGVLASAPNCESVELRRNAELPDRYLLIVGWTSLADHLENFPTTPQAEELGNAIGGFFAEPPVVEHFEEQPVT